MSKCPMGDVNISYSTSVIINSSISVGIVLVVLSKVKRNCCYNSGIVNS